MIRAVIFDFDYTLGDSTNGIVLSANYGLEQLGYSAKSVADIRKTIGLSLKETYCALTSNENPEEAEQFSRFFKEKADEVMVANTELYDGVKEMLKKLKEKGYKLGIVTTKYRYRIENILSKFEANDLIDLIVGSDDVKMEKPNPEGLLWAMEHLEVTKEEVLYVGDSLVDAKTAERAEVDFAGVLTGTTTKEDFEPYEHVFIGENVKNVYEFVLTLVTVQSQATSFRNMR